MHAPYNLTFHIFAKFSIFRSLRQFPKYMIDLVDEWVMINKEDRQSRKAKLKVHIKFAVWKLFV